MNGLLLCALLLRVEVLGLLHPREAWIDGPSGSVHAVAEGDALRLDGRPPQPRARFAAADTAGTGLRVRLSNLAPRRFGGALDLSARGGELLLVNEVDEPAYVASVIASELGPEAPPAAAEALAVVVRSFAARRQQDAGLAGPPRAHASGAPLCDQTHCQVYGALPDRRAWQAALRTRGQVLLLASGAVAPALHHAACGGRTAGAREIWPGASDDEAEAGTAVDDPLPGTAPRTLAACTELAGEAPLRWTAAVSEAQLARALGLAPPLLLSAEAGPAGRLRLLEVAGLGPLTAEELHLRLGRTVGWDAVRGPRFTFEEAPAAAAAPAARAFVLRGLGHGHGVGLCQRGAAALARSGEGAARILGRYFPRLRVGPLPSEAETR